ncbi:MAG TPA: glycoside hydrolase family 3 N-terminal domain-containing protein [Vicinamibacterales bacterium]|nr:glycoside hydrolase family 3 N-terminal domain-containing protein [Vicinamibacterales bacterium]
MSAARGGAEARLLAGCRLLRTFEGADPTPRVLAAIGRGEASGITLFRAKNVVSPAQLRALCAALQAARPAGDPPLVIGIDQEGGQLQAVGYGATAWPGNLALGATGSEDLARRAGRAIATEVAAMGGTLVFAPVCDVLHRESATALGTRPFGGNPALVARLAAAMTEGIQSVGIAASLKHFPGHGAATGDSHAGMPVVRHDLDRLETDELPPFRAAIAAGARTVLPGHLAVPALTDGAAIPATVSAALLRRLLRDRLGFTGVTVSDAMDMGGAAAAGTLDSVAIAAVDAGMDLLLLVHDPDAEDRTLAALVEAATGGRLDASELWASRRRILDLRSWLAEAEQPALDAVGSAEHAALAAEIARRSVTLVRDRDGMLPLRAGMRVALIAPVPVDLTPAETASYLRVGLAERLRERGVAVEELVSPLDPTPVQASALAQATADCDAVVVGTFDAFGHRGQADTVRAAIRTGRPVVVVALRGPFDLEAVPEAPAYTCTYGIQPPQVEALADALVGRIPFGGSLPVELDAGGDAR